MGSQDLPLNDKDFPYKPETRNRKESIRFSDEAIVAMKEEDNITPLSEGPLETGATRTRRMRLSATKAAGR